MSKISDFVEAALADSTNAHNEFELGIMPPFQGQAISQSTGIISIAGASKILTAHAIRHAFVRHGGPAKAGQSEIPLMIEDFNFLAHILSSPDTVIKGDTQNRKKNQVLKFTKVIKGATYNVLMSIVRSRESTTLVFNTMYINK